MAQWVSQRQCSSITKESRQRTAYLMPALQEVEKGIRDYFAQNKNGEEVTLAVLKCIGKQRLQALAGNMSFNRAKQDLGLFVAMILDDLYGNNFIYTFRRDDQKTVSERKNNWPDLPWVNSYTPHRLVEASMQPERILLDTVVVRGIVHGDKGALDLTRLIQIKGKHPISIADGAFGELSLQLLRGSINPKEWSARILEVDSVLDPAFPVAPGGYELAGLWSSPTKLGLDIEEIIAYYRAAWAYLKEVKSAKDLSRVKYYFGASGRAYQICMDNEASVETMFSKAGQQWADSIKIMADAIKESRSNGHEVSEEELRIQTMGNLASYRGMGLADVEKLDLAIRVLCKRAIQASQDRTPYNPKGKPNDRMDFELLFGLPLPAWVCTANKKGFYNLIQTIESSDKTKVLLPGELIERLTLESSHS